MRARLESKQRQRGWLSRKVVLEIHLTVEFSDNERTIIENGNWKDQIMVERRPTPGALKKLGEEVYDLTKAQHHLKIGDLLQETNIFACDTQVELMNYQLEYIQGLRNLGGDLIKAGADGIEMEITWDENEAA